MAIRAKDLPKLLFDTIHSVTGSPEIGELRDYRGSWEYFPVRYVPLDDPTNLAHIGYRARKEETGMIGKMVVLGQNPWSSFTTDSGEKIIADPALEIIGGPFEGGTWVAGRGQRIYEKVTAKLSFASNVEGITLNSSFTGFLIEVLRSARSLAIREGIKPHDYWEAYQNPDGNHTRPRN